MVVAAPSQLQQTTRGSQPQSGAIMGTAGSRHRGREREAVRDKKREGQGRE